MNWQTIPVTAEEDEAWTEITARQVAGTVPFTWRRTVDGLVLVFGESAAT